MLENDGSLLACALNAASAALTEAAVPMISIIGVTQQITPFCIAACHAFVPHRVLGSMWLTALVHGMICTQEIVSVV